MNNAIMQVITQHDLKAASWDEVLALQDVKEGWLAKAYTKFTGTVFNDE